MTLVLLLLAAYYCYATLREQYPTGQEAAGILAGEVLEQYSSDQSFLLAAGTDQESLEFLEFLDENLQKNHFTKIRKFSGEPSGLRKELVALESTPPAAILATREVAQWRLLQNLGEKFKGMEQTEILQAPPYTWPDFLKLSNLLAIGDRTVVIAIIAIGMTMVIITGGIDLAVGSLIALSAVLYTYIVVLGGGESASNAMLYFAMLLTLIASGVLGCINGILVAKAKVAPFIATLAVMMAARGGAFILAKGESIYQLPEALTTLGRGYTLGIPNTIILLIVLYAIAHIVMTRTVLGRWIYAVGGNMEASRLAGVPVTLVLVVVYVISAMCAGLGGIIQASQLKSGAPTYGVSFELYVIAAVVIGGTSLSGGSGKILNTLIGALIIAVIQNGMNLTGVESYTQQVVLGLVILGAVLLDKFKASALAAVKPSA